jgi:hypothetical protein
MTREKTIVLAHKKNWKVLQEAIKNGDAGLLECELKATGEKVAVITAFAHEDNGEITMTPFAMFFNGNPYELLNPPNPDGGFHQE